jgi:hypothetical protein
LLLRCLGLFFALLLLLFLSLQLLEPGFLLGFGTRDGLFPCLALFLLLLERG